MLFKRKHKVSPYDRKRSSCKPAIALMLGFALLINSPLSTLASETNEVITTETVLQNDTNMESGSDAAFSGSGADTQLCDTDTSLNINDFSLEAETSGSDIIIETEDLNIETLESSSEMVLDIDTVPATECVPSDVCENESPESLRKSKNCLYN